MAVLLALAPTLVLAGAYLIALTFVRRESASVRTVLVTILQVLQIRYSAWRTYTIVTAFEPTFSWACSFAFLLVELVAVVLSYRAIRVFRRTAERTTEADANQGWWHRLPQPPLVDVLIPTYNEGRAILERTLAGAQGIDYERLRIWVLDDGRREWLRQLAAQRGVGYVTRTSNAGYKAGNLNHGLAHIATLGERAGFVAVFDADFIARPHFINRTLAMMASEDVGLVQTPQYFYNPDPFQYALRAASVWPDEQRGWFDARLPALDAVGAATCCGTSCLIRASALEAVGGFPTESVSEDTLLSLKMRRSGLQTTYLKEFLSVGLAPEGIVEFLTQRARWCEGSLQIARDTEWGPGAGKGRLHACLLRTEATMRWAWFSFMKIAWMVLPPLYLFFGFTLIKADLTEFVSYLAPVIVARFGLTWISANTLMPIATDAPAVVLAPVVIRTTLNALLGRSSKGFTVTDKGINRSRVVFHARIARMPLALLVLTVAALAWAWLDEFSPLHSPGSRVLIVAWALLNCTVLIAALAPCLEPPKFRACERFSCDVKVGVESGGRICDARMVDLSEAGCRLECVGIVVAANLRVNVPGIGWLHGRVRRRLARGQLGIAFEMDREQRDRLIRHVYCSGLFMAARSEWSMWGSFAAVARYMAR